MLYFTFQFSIMVNKVFLVGRLGKNPVIKKFQNDNAIAEVPLATDETYRDKQGNKVEQTEWHNLKFPFRSQAEIVEKYLRKGSMIFVEGKIKTRSYEDKDNQKRYITEIIVENFRMLDSKRDVAPADSSGAAPAVNDDFATGETPMDAPADAPGDDLPF